MITGIGVQNNDPMVLLGLSGEDITNLVAGEAIKVSVAGVNLLLVYGKTEENIIKNIEPMLSSETHGVHRD